MNTERFGEIPSYRGLFKRMIYYSHFVGCSRELSIHMNINCLRVNMANCFPNFFVNIVVVVNIK